MFNHGEKTWEQKGTKHVQKLGLKYKRKLLWWYLLMLQGTYFHHKLCLLTLYLKHFHQTTKEKEIASNMVGTSPSLKPLVILGNNQIVCHKHSPSQSTITYSNFKVKEGAKDGVDHG